MENIRLGDPAASDAQVMQAARQAQCAEFIEALDDGYHTVVGNDGARLSAGQRQRIVIARAILKNTPILILDEATAYADMENQQKMRRVGRCFASWSNLTPLATSPVFMM